MITGSSIILSVYLSVCLFVCLSVSLSVPLSVCSDNLSVQVFVEMPFDIKSIECPTHKIKMKVSECVQYLWCTSESGRSPLSVL